MEVYSMLNRYVAAFLVIELLISAYFVSHYFEKRALHHAEDIFIIQNSLEAAIGSYEMVNDAFYAAHADGMAYALHRANRASKEERDAIRKKLRETYGLFYNDQKLLSLEALHLIDAQGRSLLRFHAPQHYDDLIAQKRYSMRLMAQTTRFTHGIEIGVFKDAYRFQYPLFYDGTYVGFFEYGIGFDAIIREMEKIQSRQYAMLFMAERIDAICTCSAKNERYETLSIGDTVLYQHRAPSYRRYNDATMRLLIERADFARLIQSRKSGVIDYWHDFKHHSVVVLPLSDIEGKHTAYFIAKLKFTHGKELLESLLIDISLALLLGIALVYLYRKELQHQRYVRDILNTQKEMIILTDGLKIQDANAAMLDFFGYGSLDSFSDVHACICDFFIDEEGFLSKEQNGIRWLEYILAHPGTDHYVKMYDRTLREERIFLPQIQRFKNSNAYVVSFKDLTEQYRKSRALETQANHDALTGIYNRAKFDEALMHELHFAKRYRSELSIIMFDIDHFKQINDTFGHDAGDRALQNLTSLVSEHIRDVDLFARWDGEEFMIVTRTSLDQAVILAQKLRRLCEESRFDAIETLTCSFGVAHWHDDESKAELIKRVDELLYKAKEEGRNRVVSEQEEN
ncbi:MAG: diguanylate cyclase [Campylobacterales bacterium]|nr:diguanylate cyclase [Campylobacterales bacterium]